MQPIVIFGAGGFGREVLQLIRDINRVSPQWECLGFLSDATGSQETVAGLPVLGGIDWLAGRPEVSVVVAIGNSVARRRVVGAIQARCNNAFPALVHPRAWVGDYVEMGPGSIICAGSLVTTDISLGQHVHVNIGSTIGHDATLADYVTLNPSVNVSGNVHLREGCQVGTGSVLIPGCEVGNWSILGAGAIVTQSIDANVTAVGAPARPIKQRASGWHLEN